MLATTKLINIVALGHSRKKEKEGVGKPDLFRFAGISCNLPLVEVYEKRSLVGVVGYHLFLVVAGAVLLNLDDLLLSFKKPNKKKEVIKKRVKKMKKQ